MGRHAGGDRRDERGGGAGRQLAEHGPIPGNPADDHDLNDAELKSAALVPNGPHEVFISLRLDSGTYYISIKQTSASFSNGTGTYTMDDVIMREK